MLSFTERIIFVVFVLVLLLSADSFILPQHKLEAAPAISSTILPPLSKFEMMEMSKPTIKPLNWRAVRCLADNIYYEAGNQPYEGKLGVAFVTMNRLGAEGYPNTVCGVVYEKKHHTYCQFSWVCERHTRFERQMWEDALHIATAVVEYYQSGVGEQLEDPTHGALFFHTTWVHPVWKSSFIKTTQIADHIFYRKE